MKALLPTILALLTPLTLAQQALIPTTLPACTAQCTVLQNAQGSCQTNPTTQTSCFCQDANLQTLYATNPVQLCTSCSATDMQTIQTWYQGFCKTAAQNPAAANPPTPTSSSTTAHTTSTSATKGASAAAATGGSNQGSTPNPSQGPWFSTHWRWVVMLIVLFVGLTLLGVGGTFLHRRYHRKREARFGAATGSHVPNINTWGPGQSVHDLGYTTQGGVISGVVPYQEKGKAKEQVRGVREPVPARMREMRPAK